MDVEGSNRLPKLLSEKYLLEQGIMYNSIRAPSHLFNSAALAVVAAQVPRPRALTSQNSLSSYPTDSPLQILRSGQSNKHVVVEGSAQGITIEGRHKQDANAFALLFGESLLYRCTNDCDSGWQMSFKALGKSQPNTSPFCAEAPEVKAGSIFNSYEPSEIQTDIHGTIQM